MTRPTPSIDVGRAVELYGQGLTIYRIGAELGLSGVNISRHLRKAGVRMRVGARPFPIDTATIVRLRDVDGWTWQRIADEVGMTMSGVCARYRRQHQQPAVPDHKP